MPARPEERPSPSRTRLEGRDPTADIITLPVEPERELRILFRREQQLEKQRLEVSAGLLSARKAYAAANGLAALPRMELLRTRFAPPPPAPVGVDGPAKKSKSEQEQ